MLPHACPRPRGRARLNGLHTCVETSGYADDATFADVMATVDLAMLDVKLIDPEAHRRWTGVDNASILRHAEMLRDGDTPYVLRVPVIPGVNDNDAHFAGVAALCKGAKRLLRVELLPYHKTAGAKYGMVGMRYAVDFDPERAVHISPGIFERAGVPCRVL